MFNENSEIFLLTKKRAEYKVFKFKLEVDAKKLLISSFNRFLKDYKFDNPQNINLVDYTNFYHLENDELYRISNYKMLDKVLEAIDNPDLTDDFEPKAEYKNFKKGEDYKICAIFVGEKVNDKYRIVFQKFDTRQVLTTERTLWFDGSQFRKMDKFLLSVNEKNDCLFDSDNLIFENINNASKIFDLSEYNRTATEEDIIAFEKASFLKIQKGKKYDKQILNSTNKKLVAQIIDKKVLENDISTIIGWAKTDNFVLNIENNQIVVPDDNRNFKNLLYFLALRTFKDKQTGEPIIANSTRKIE